MLVFCTVQVADAIVFEASLSFIGAGVRPPDPSWGSVIADGKNMVLTGGWWATVFPGLLILITVLVAEHPGRGRLGRVGGAGGAGRCEVRDATDDRLEAPEPGHAARSLAAARPDDAAAARLRARARPCPHRRAGAGGGEPHHRLRARHAAWTSSTASASTVRPGEVLGLVGESGCGKSLTALTVMGLEPKGARVTRPGPLRPAGPAARNRCAVRRTLLGHEMAMIYQDALSSLNPAMTIRAQLKQVVRRGGRRTPAELLDLVGLDPDRTLRSYPHELSGGQRQRVLIAMALSRDPKLIVADEPTTALDVTVQAQVIELLLRLRAELGFALILVSHDLALVARRHRPGGRDVRRADRGDRRDRRPGRRHRPTTTPAACSAGAVPGVGGRAA